MSTASIRERLLHTLIPAVPAIFERDSDISHAKVDLAQNVRYAAWMADQSIGGVAVWAHTGRGLWMDETSREQILRTWRSALPTQVIVAGAGSREMAEHAASLGADAILAFPPTMLRALSSSERFDRIVAYHQSLAAANIPLILFLLYDAAGGINYSDAELRTLFSLECVAGIKLATLDSVMTFQRVRSLLKREFPDLLLITGEDRFLGYSLMMGADAALIGMGAARTEMQAALLDACYAHEDRTFRALSQHCDAFAELTFSEPMEGYIGRMLHVLEHDGVIGNTRDPWGPILSDGECGQIDRFLDSL